MKTLCKSLFALAAFALVSTTAAQAATVIHVSGSTAYRAAAINAIAHVLTSPTAVYVGSSLAGANDVAYQGTLSGTTYEIRCHFGGSVTGIAGLTQPASNQYNFLVWDASAAAVTPGGQSNFYSPYGLLASAGGGTSLTSVTQNTPADTNSTNCGFSDGFQATAAQVPGAAATINAATLVDLGPLGILPFAFLKGAAQTTDGDYTDGTYNRITDITAVAGQQLYGANSMPAELLTSNTGDSQGFVYAVGRDQDSGTRIAAFAETGYGVGNVPGQYQVVTSGGVSPGPDATVANLVLFSTPTFPTIGGGYGSGGNVATALECSGWDNSNLPNSNYGYGIGYLGAADTDTAITAGFEVTANVTGSSTTYTAAGLTGSNVTQAIAAGQNVYIVSTSAASQAIPTSAYTTVNAVNTGTKQVTLNLALPAGTYNVLIDTLTGTGYVRPQFLTFNGVTLNQANINQGKYQFWEYEHFFLPAGGSPNAFQSALVAELKSTDAKVAGYLLTSMTANGGAGTTQKSSEGKPIHY